MKRYALIAIASLAMLATAAPAAAHCQIPCGIFHDELRVQLIEEHITTIEKSMKKIDEISASETPDYNQLVRWVMNKEDHAQQIQDIVSAYFLAQRIKPPKDQDNEAETKEYLHQLALLHHIQIHAMKAKQSTDLGQIESLRKMTSNFRKAYFGEDGSHEH